MIINAEEGELELIPENPDELRKLYKVRNLFVGGISNVNVEEDFCKFDAYRRALVIRIQEKELKETIEQLEEEIEVLKEELSWS